MKKVKVYRSSYPNCFALSAVVEMFTKLGYIVRIVPVLLLMTLTTQAQNLIQNGTMDGPGPLADGWHINAISTPTLTDGVQRVESPFTASIYQDITLPAGDYRLSFDMENSNFAQVVLWIDSITGFVVGPNPMPISSMTHYDYNMTVYNDCYRIEFRTVPNYATWLRLDNVVLTRVFPVGMTELSRPAPPPEYYDMRGQRLPREPTTGFYIRKIGTVTTKHWK